MTVYGRSVFSNYCGFLGCTGCTGCVHVHVHVHVCVGRVVIDCVYNYVISEIIRLWLVILCSN